MRGQNCRKLLGETARNSRGVGWIDQDGGEVGGMMQDLGDECAQVGEDSEVDGGLIGEWCSQSHADRVQQSGGAVGQI